MPHVPLQPDLLGVLRGHGLREPGEGLLPGEVPAAGPGTDGRRLDMMGMNLNTTEIGNPVNSYKTPRHSSKHTQGLQKNDIFNPQREHTSHLIVFAILRRRNWISRILI